MSFGLIDDIFCINVDMVLTLAVAAVVLLVGLAIGNKVKFFKKYCIPAAVIGGFLVCLIVFIGYLTKTFVVSFDTTFQNIFMLAFFTTVGLSVELSDIKKGSKSFFIYWGLVVVIALAQGPIALFVGDVFSVDKAYSITAGAITMCGGHGGGAAFGSTIADRGYPAAQDCAMACATLGLVFSVLVGGPLARRLIKKNKLKPEKKFVVNVKQQKQTQKAIVRKQTDVLKNIAIVLICMALGTTLSKSASTGLTSLIGQSEITIPDYIGAMFISVLFRNLNEKFKWIKFDANLCSSLGTISLDIFLAIAMMSIELWQLIGFLNVLFIIVLIQVVIVSLYSYYVIPNVLGRDYDAAVMCGGFCGHALGSTPTAMANMGAVVKEYGFTQKPFIIVPVIAAFLADVFWQPFNIFLINLLIPAI